MTAVANGVVCKTQVELTVYRPATLKKRDVFAVVDKVRTIAVMSSSNVDDIARRLSRDVGADGDFYDASLIEPLSGGKFSISSDQPHVEHSISWCASRAVAFANGEV